MATTNRRYETSVGSAGAGTAPTRRARPRRPALLAWFFRIPVFLYRVGLAEQLGRSTLLLTTRGRRTGRWRTTALNYLTEGDVTYVLAGMGPGSDWLRNLQADPHVQVQVGRRRFAARADTIADPTEHRRVLSLGRAKYAHRAPAGRAGFHAPPWLRLQRQRPQAPGGESATPDRGPACDPSGERDLFGR
jgi:deazaflavin-dependent oxidoreductase (nitroreductase family)